MSARGLNYCTFIGNLGTDCELRSANGSSVVNVSIAVNEVWGTGDDRQQRVEWVPLVVWGRLAEVMSEYCRKGSKVYVGGRLQTRKWNDDTSQPHYRTEIVVRDLIMLDTPNRVSGDDTLGERGAVEEEEDLPF